MIGVVRDPVFGPAIAFGAGGTAVEVLRDRALALPPLNAYLAADMIARTRVARLLGAFRNLPPVNAPHSKRCCCASPKWCANCLGSMNSTSTR